MPNNAYLRILNNFFENPKGLNRVFLNVFPRTNRARIDHILNTHFKDQVLILAFDF